MSIQQVEIVPLEPALPARVLEVISDAWESIRDFQDRTRRDPVQGFHPSDFEQAYHWLVAVKSLIKKSQPRFCEWGSGFGVVSFLAELIGFESTAIESDSALFDAAAEWRQKMGAKFEALRGSFVPKDYAKKVAVEQDLNISRIDRGKNTMWLSLDATAVYDAGAIGEFDLIYAYPWPGEESFVFNLFNEFASSESWLLTFHGAADFRLHRK